MRFDFGRETSPLEEGYTRIANTTEYTSTKQKSDRSMTKKETLDSKREKGSTPENMERAHHRNQRKSPMICPNCENCYEYMGELCLDNGELVSEKALK